MLEEVEEQGRGEVDKNAVSSEGDAVRAGGGVGGAHYGTGGEIVGRLEDLSTVNLLVEVEFVEEGPRGECIVGVFLPEPPPRTL
jgi:hypothetical protein